MVPRWLLRPVIPALILWSLALLAIFFIVDVTIMPAVAGRFSKTVTVPSVVGMETGPAADTLKAHGLRFAVDTLSDYSRTIPKGRILSQRPDSGSVVKGDRRIWATLSRGRSGPGATATRNLEP